MSAGIRGRHPTPGSEADFTPAYSGLGSGCQVSRAVRRQVAPWECFGYSERASAPGLPRGKGQTNNVTFAGVTGNIPRPGLHLSVLRAQFEKELMQG